MNEYLLDTGWACGWIKTGLADVIVETAPIFKKLIGTCLHELPKSHKLHDLSAWKD